VKATGAINVSYRALYMDVCGV